MIGHRAELEAVVEIGEASAAGDLQQRVVIDAGGDRRGARHFLTRLPFELDRGHGEKQRTGEIALATDPGLRHRFLGRDIG